MTATEALPLVGRDDVVGRIASLLDEGAGGVVLVGPAGVGKTRIARAALDLAAERGHAIVRTIGTQAAAGIPLGALSHLLPDLSRVEGNVLAAARTALVDRAGDRPLMMLIDDAHLIDDHSAALVLQLALSVRSFLVVTARADEPVSDAVFALWKDGLAERIDVGPLDDPSVARMVDHLLAGPVDPTVTRAITSRAAGSPLIARELTLAGVASAAVAVVDGRWVLQGELAVSSRLRALVQSRIDRLEAAEREALELVAFGEPLGVAVAHRLVSERALIGLERSGLVEVRADQRRQELWLTHPVHATVVRATAGTLGAAARLRALAETTRGFGMRRRGDVITIATWLLEAGTAEPRLLLAAARETYRAFDLAATARLARRAWDVEPTSDSGFLLGAALAWTGRYPEADAVLAAATKAATAPGDRAMAAVMHATVVWSGLRLPDAALDLLRQTEERLDDHDSVGLVLAQRAYLLALGSDIERALRLALPILARGEGHAFVLAALAVELAHIVRGSHQAALELIDRALPEHRILWDARMIHLPPELQEHYRQSALVAVGDFASVATFGSEAGDHLPGEPGRPAGAVWQSWVLARAAYLRGRPLEAERLLAPWEHGGLGGPQRYTLVQLALVRAVTGRPDDAAAALAAAEQLAPTTSRAMSAFDDLLDEATVWTLAAQGRPREARSAAAHAADRLMAPGRWGVAHNLVHDLARLGDPGGARARLEAFPHRVDGALPDARALHVVGLSTGAADDLEAAHGAFAALGADLFAAEAAAAAASAARRDGDQRRATRLSRITREFAARCEGARTPALVLPDAVVALTAREQEIAALAARGVASRQIADRLHLSVRTVDNHLQHVYVKLGVLPLAVRRRALLARAFP